MPPMISHAKEVILIRLIRSGALPERKLATEAGVSRGTVRKFKATYARAGRERNPASFEHGEPGKIGRCRCGAKVVFPCRACELRKRLGLDAG
jgi:hypothetical protein